MFQRRILPLCGLLLAGAIAHQAQAATTLKESFDQTVPLRAGSEVRLTNVNGRVTFEAWDRGEVRIEAEKQVRAGDADKARKLMSQIKIEVTPGPAGLRIDTRIPRHEEGGGFIDAMFGNNVSIGVSYRVHVPRRAAVNVLSSNGGIELSGTRGNATLKTSNGGLTVREVEGEMSLKSTNGAITVERSAGAVQAETSNGGIHAELTKVYPNRAFSLESSNGGVSLSVPRDSRFSVDAETSNGRVASDFPVPGEKAGRHTLKGNINGGGPKLLIRTSNGGVHIRES